jgi:hypothetical protein
LDPSHWTLLPVSKQDKTVTAAVDLLAAFRKFIPASAADKQKHVAAVRTLTAIVSNNPHKRELLPAPPRVDNAKPQRVDGATSSRVATAPTPRVAVGLTPSNSPTCPLILHTTPLKHQ